MALRPTLRVETDAEFELTPMLLSTLLSQLQTERVTIPTMINPATSSPPNHGQKTGRGLRLSAGRLPVVVGVTCSSGLTGISDNCLDILSSSPRCSSCLSFYSALLFKRFCAKARYSSLALYN